MKQVLFFLSLLMLVSGLAAQNYVPVDASSSVKFSIKNFGSAVPGTFKGLQGKIVFNTKNVTSSSFNVTIDASTINTGNHSRDKHLVKEEYFNAATYPKISFISTKISNSNKEDTFIMDGDITIKGVKHAVSFLFTATTQADSYLFVGQFKLNRRDFNVGGSSLVLSDDLTVYLSVVAKKN